MHFPRSQRIAVVLLAALALAACGFHLRDSRSAALKIEADKIFVDADNADDLADEVRSQLKSGGVQISSSADDAQFVVLLSRQNFRRDVLSVSPKTGKVEEYQLTLSARLSLREVGGGKLLDNDPISLVRDYTFDQNEVLGKFSEEETLRNELTRDAAEQVMRRVSAVLANRK